MAALGSAFSPAHDTPTKMYLCEAPYAVPLFPRYTAVGFNTGSGYVSCYWLKLQEIGSYRFSLAFVFAEYVTCVYGFFLVFLIFFCLVLIILEKSHKATTWKF